MLLAINPDTKRGTMVKHLHNTVTQIHILFGLPKLVHHLPVQTDAPFNRIRIHFTLLSIDFDTTSDTSLHLIWFAIDDHFFFDFLLQ